MRNIIASVSVAALIAAPALAEQTLEGVAADTYQLDKTHAFLTWTVRHNGLSGYTVNFTDFDATLEFDPEDLSASSITVTINPMALETNGTQNFPPMTASSMATNFRRSPSSRPAPSRPATSPAP